MSWRGLADKTDPIGRRVAVGAAAWHAGRPAVPANGHGPGRRAIAIAGPPRARGESAASRVQNDRFAKFSQRARAVLALAQEEAQAFNHNYIGTEHLLLGLLREREGVAARVLADLGVDLAKATAAFELIVGRGDRAPAGAIGLTPRARKVVQLALEEARNLGHHYIGTEHLLLGLLAEGEGVAAAVLGSMGVRPEDARRRTIARLGGDALADADAEAGRGTPIGPLVSFRPDPDELAAIDRLVADGVRPTREEAIAWLVHLGLEAQRRRGDGGGQAPDEPDGRPEDDPPAAR